MSEDIQPDGVGSFYFAFEQLKKKLESEGLFSQSKKRALPKIPTRIGIITSPTGAAVQDMINILNRRFPYAKVLLYPSLVQGAQAAQQLISALNYFNQSGSADLIIIGRGGGSIEDLWAFNDEALARTISASQIPVISAVGHETDFTICDFAADLRAPTPSAAAEIAVPETEELKRKINNIIGRTELLLSQSIAHKKQALTLLSSQGSLNKPQRLIDDWRMLVLSLQDNIMRKTELANLNRRSVLSNAAAKLDALSPLAILARGYAVALDSEGTLLRKKSDTKVGARINIRVSDGQILSEVIDIN